MAVALFVLLIWANVWTKVIGEVADECSFADTWTRDQWMTHLMTSPPNTPALMTYHRTYAYASSSDQPHFKFESYVCWVYEDVAGHVTYLQIRSMGMKILAGTCVQEQSHEGILIHKETPYAYEGDVSTSSVVMTHCEQELAKVPLHSVYLPVEIDLSTGTTEWNLPESADCPFENIPYHVEYTTEDGHVYCSSKKSSGLNVHKDTISILACDYNSNPGLPLTGTLSCKAKVSPATLGETEVAGEGIVIFEWKSRTQTEPHYYCSRYKQNAADRSVDISFDITSSRAIRCQKGAKANWFGQHESRNYFTMKLHYDQSLVSDPVTPTTTTTARPSEPAPDHLQFTINSTYVNSLKMKDELTNVISDKLTSFCMISRSRISGVDLDKDSIGTVRTEVTVNIADGRPTVPTCADILWHKMSFDGKIEFAVNGVLVNIVNGTIHHWRDDSLCPQQVCQNSGKCRLWHGQYTCQCPEGNDNSGFYCTDPAITLAASPSSTDNKMVIIISLVVCAIVLLLVTIVVVVVVTKRRYANKEATASNRNFVSGLDSLEEQDRQMYSTISKQPAAYHEKYFLSDDEDSVHGERTGIHVNSAYM